MAPCGQAHHLGEVGIKGVPCLENNNNTRIRCPSTLYIGTYHQATPTKTTKVEFFIHVQSTHVNQKNFSPSLKNVVIARCIDDRCVLTYVVFTVKLVQFVVKNWISSTAAHCSLAMFDG